MREKLETRSLAELKEMAKNVGLKGISGLRKAELIDLLCAQEEKGKQASASKPQEKPCTSEKRTHSRPRSGIPPAGEPCTGETTSAGDPLSRRSRPQENRVRDKSCAEK